MSYFTIDLPHEIRPDLVSNLPLYIVVPIIEKLVLEAGNDGNISYVGHFKRPVFRNQILWIMPG